MGYRYGVDLVFTYGPLGYVLHPEAVANNVTIARKGNSEDVSFRSRREDEDLVSDPVSGLFAGILTSLRYTRYQNPAGQTGGLPHGFQ